MKYIIGVDGGGTKTEVAVCDLTGKVHTRLKGGSSNPNDIGNEAMLKVVGDLIERALPFDCEEAFAGLGISGIFTAGSENYLCDGLKKRFPFLRAVKAYSDKDSALNCAFNGDGCIVIIGTGSVGAVKKGDKLINIGGGGYLIDDALSGFDLGREVLNAVLCDNDGIGDKTLLTALFYEKTGENIRDHLKTVYKRGKAYIASFSPLVFAALSAGDGVADSIMKKCVRGFERLLSAVCKAWGETPCEIVLFGGLTAQIEVISRYLSEDITRKVKLSFPELPVIYGLVKEFSLRDDDFKENFASSYANCPLQCDF